MSGYTPANELLESNRHEIHALRAEVAALKSQVAALTAQRDSSAELAARAEEAVAEARREMRARCAKAAAISDPDLLRGSPAWRAGYDRGRAEASAAVLALPSAPDAGGKGKPPLVLDRTNEQVTRYDVTASAPAMPPALWTFACERCGPYRTPGVAGECHCGHGSIKPNGDCACCHSGSAAPGGGT